MSIIIFLAILIVLILVHEFGHFIVAKKSGIRVDEFGIGFPPKLYGKKFGETEYTINALPLGGFVRIWGEDPTDEDYAKDDEHTRSFVAQPRYIQALVLVAGVFMNILFAYFLFVLAYVIGMPTALDATSNRSEYESVKLYVTGVLENSPASKILLINDEITSVESDGEKITKEAISPDTVSAFIREHEGEEVMLTVVREGKEHTKTVTPQKGILQDNPEIPAAGFTMVLSGVKEYSLFESFYQAFIRTGEALIAITLGLVELLGGIFTGSSDFSQISGPVGIVGLVGDAASLGFIWVITFSAFISLNLAVINLFPFPALDGGRLVFVFIESIIRRPIPPAIATNLNRFGFIALLVLMAAVTFNDVVKIL